MSSRSGGMRDTAEALVTWPNGLSSLLFTMESCSTSLGGIMRIKHLSLLSEIELFTTYCCRSPPPFTQQQPSLVAPWTSRSYKLHSSILLCRLQKTTKKKYLHALFALFTIVVQLPSTLWPVVVMGGGIKWKCIHLPYQHRQMVIRKRTKDLALLLSVTTPRS